MRTLLQMILLACLMGLTSLCAQDYFLAKKGPFNPDIPSPEAFLGYGIGDMHTRHDRMVAYFQALANSSPRATLVQYGQTHGKRPLVILIISSEANMNQLMDHRKAHLQLCDPAAEMPDISKLPVFVNLGYNVHGNEPSGGEASLLTAYTLVASEHKEAKRYRDQSIVFIDPVINPDGRDRHTHWANMYQGNPLVSDPQDAEHNEAWPRGRTNHYWFDLNRDWLLAIHPESRGKLNWYHKWYPNVVTDFHEMGTNSSYFFEPMKTNGSKEPIMPEENYTTLNDTFAEYYVEAMDGLGSLYFTKEVFDGTYPGYGSSYPDLQGGLGILFEQASSRGHIQQTPTGKLTFAFTIRNQYTSSIATVHAAVNHKDLLHRYQRDFFTSALTNAQKDPVKAYVFGDKHDPQRTQALIDKLLYHKVKLYELKNAVSQKGETYEPGSAFVVPTNQPQYRMVQTVFESYKEYTDSVFYDASAWSLIHFYNLPYAGLNRAVEMGEEVTSSDLSPTPTVERSRYAYLIPWEYYNAPAVLNYLQQKGVSVHSSFKSFSANVGEETKDFGYGTLMVSVQRQRVNPNSLYTTLVQAAKEFKVPIYAVKTGYSQQGIDLGSRYVRPLSQPKAALLMGEGVNSYEAGEVWHLLDTRVNMPITKLRLARFAQSDINRYNVIVMVSGSYNQLDQKAKARLSDWVKLGNTLITIRQGTSWAIKQKLVKEALIKPKKDTTDQPIEYLPYTHAPEILGQERVGGAIFEAELDITHPLGFGYTRNTLPVYRNSQVWLKPSKNPFSTVVRYTDDPHIDGFITEKNLETYLKPSASLIVSKLGRGRVIMFADNPNFRGSWYGTNRLFLNALFLGKHIQVPAIPGGEEE